MRDKLIRNSRDGTSLVIKDVNRSVPVPSRAQKGFSRAEACAGRAPLNLQINFASSAAARLEWLITRFPIIRSTLLDSYQLGESFCLRGSLTGEFIASGHKASVVGSAGQARCGTKAAQLFLAIHRATG
jgi:hypothetical protein